MPSLTESNYNVIFLPPLLVSQIENPDHFPRTFLFFLSPQLITSTSMPILFHVTAQVLDLILYRSTLETINFVSNEHLEHYNSKNTTRKMCIYKAKKKKKKLLKTKPTLPCAFYSSPSSATHFIHPRRNQNLQNFLPTNLPKTHKRHSNSR
jgi:hypothetical protein